MCEWHPQLALRMPSLFLLIKKNTLQAEGGDVDNPEATMQATVAETMEFLKEIGDEAQPEAAVPRRAQVKPTSKAKADAGDAETPNDKAKAEAKRKAKAEAKRKAKAKADLEVATNNPSGGGGAGGRGGGRGGGNRKGGGGGAKITADLRT